MGRIDWDANEPAEVDALVRYVAMIGPNRLYLVRTKKNEVCVRERVKSKLDSAYMVNVTDKVWADIRERLVPVGNIELFPATGYSWAEERLATGVVTDTT